MSRAIRWPSTVAVKPGSAAARRRRVRNSPFQDDVKPEGELEDSVKHRPSEQAFGARGQA